MTGVLCAKHLGYASQVDPGSDHVVISAVHITFAGSTQVCRSFVLAIVQVRSG